MPDVFGRARAEGAPVQKRGFAKRSPVRFSPVRSLERNANAATNDVDAAERHCIAYVGVPDLRVCKVMSGLNGVVKILDPQGHIIGYAHFDAAAIDESKGTL